MSVSTIRRMQERGDLTAVLVEGTWRFDPADLDAVDVTTANEPAADVLAHATGLVRQSHAHNERLLDLLVKPIAQLTEAMGAQTAAMAAQAAKMADRIDVLEKKNTEMLAASEDALSLQHERHLKELEFHASQDRKNQAFAQLTKIAPLIANHWMQHVSRAPVSPPVAAVVASDSAQPGDVANPTVDDGEEDKDMITVLEMVASLTDPQLDALCATDVVTANQRAALQRVRAAIQTPAEAPVAAGGPAASTPAAEAESPVVPKHAPPKKKRKHP